MRRINFLLAILYVFTINSWLLVLFKHASLLQYHLLSAEQLQERKSRENLFQRGTSATHTRIIVKRLFEPRPSYQNLRIRSNSKREILLTPKQTSSNVYLSERYFNDFKREWCRIHSSRLEWKRILAACAEYTRWGEKNVSWGIENRTDAFNSFVFNWDIRPAGQFSKFFIQSKTSANKTKYFGGDSWRVHINGVASVSPTIFDHNNGTYEVIFLLMEAGYYQISITLDYTLCDGFKDPPVDWYKKGNIQGKNQPDGTLQGERSYLMQPLGGGKSIIINISEEESSKNIEPGIGRIQRQLIKHIAHKNRNICDRECGSLMWDGFGRWKNDSWSPFVKDFDTKREPHKHQGILWIYGDSVSKMFKEALVTGKYYEVCEKIFRMCKITYTWVYNMDGYNKGKKKEPLPDGKDYDHHKVMGDIKKVLYHKEMDEHSVILLNWGIHFAAAVNFSNYRRLIDEFIETVKLEKRRQHFKGKIIWKTTTAIFRERYTNPHKDVRRFLTFPRIILYNAYAMSAMCKAGIDVIDVYPMSDSFPSGTLSKNDPVHYERRVFESVEQLIHRKFKSMKYEE